MGRISKPPRGREAGVTRETGQGFWDGVPWNRQSQSSKRGEGFTESLTKRSEGDDSRDILEKQALVLLDANILPSTLDTVGKRKRVGINNQSGVGRRKRTAREWWNAALSDFVIPLVFRIPSSTPSLRPRVVRGDSGFPRRRRVVKPTVKGLNRQNGKRENGMRTRPETGRESRHGVSARGPWVELRVIVSQDTSPQPPVWTTSRRSTPDLGTKCSTLPAENTV